MKLKKPSNASGVISIDIGMADKEIKNGVFFRTKSNEHEIYIVMVENGVETHSFACAKILEAMGWVDSNKEKDVHKIIDAVLMATVSEVKK